MTSTLLPSTFLLCVTSLVQAQTPKLLKDINAIALPTSSNPSPLPPQLWTGDLTFKKVGNQVVMRAYTQASGYELWVSDGTPAGTRMLKDIFPGPDSGDPRSLRVTRDGKRAIFMARAGTTTGALLWVTDGTSKGTLQIKSTGPSDEIVAFGQSSLIFRGLTPTTGNEMFISDGTARGTKLLKDIWPGRGGSSPKYLRATRDGKKVFFTAFTKPYRYKLWVTDGTTTGTYFVKDIRPGSLTSLPSYLVPIGPGSILFQANDGISGNELWISDGTIKGTRRVVDLYKGPQSGVRLKTTIVLGNKVLFRGFSPSTGWETYVSDGTAKGTVLLIDANPGVGSASFESPHLDTAGKKIYWRSSIGKGDYRIIVTNGTPTGTKVFTPKNIGPAPNPASSLGTAIAEILGKVYFEGLNLTPGTGYELCVSDGTLAGTKTFRDTNKGSSSGRARGMTRINTATLWYAADDGKVGNELWRMLGGQLTQLIDINRPKHGPTLDSNPASIGRLGKYILFSANDSKTGHETWISDGTASGTRLLKDLYPGYRGSDTRYHAAAGDRIVFDAYTLATGEELFVTDGTTAGTKLLKDFIPGPRSSHPENPTSIGGKVYFSGVGGRSGREPWVTDGTTAGTKLLKDLNPGSASSFPRDFTGQGDHVVFQAWSASTGRELYISDGTAKGTRLLKDINPGIASSSPSQMVYTAGKVFFAAFTPKTGWEIWITDFTSKGTRLVKDLYPGTQSGAFSDPAARNGRVYFLGRTAATGNELFVSDGTAAGTKLLLDYRPGPTNGEPSRISAIGSRHIYFAALTTTGQGWETVILDTRSLTTKVIDLSPGANGGMGFFQRYLPYRLVIGSRVFIGGSNPLHGYEVYMVDNGATAEPIGTPFGSTWIYGSDPVLGKTATITGGTMLGNAVHVTLFGSLAAVPTRLGTAGFIHFDLKSYFGITGVSKGKSFQHSLPVPNSPALKGVQAIFQTLSFDSNNLAGTLELSNGLHWAIGN